MKYGLILLFLICVISNTYASTDCLQRPSCEELGYVQTRKMCACFNKDILPCPFNIKDDNTVFCGDLPCKEKCKAAYPLFSGKENTKAAVDQIGEKALAAYAATQFYVGDKDGDFGQGKWYLPSIGEWMSFFGTDPSLMTKGEGESGGLGDNKYLINNALMLISAKGAEAEILKIQYYWSSSTVAKINAWILYTRTGARYSYNRSFYSYAVRCFLLLKNYFNPSAGGIPPKVGDVMYEDKTFGSAEDYDGSKSPVGIIASVSGTRRDVAIINLKDLTFGSKDTPNNFTPENPYGNTETKTYWSTQDKQGESISRITDISSEMMLNLLQASCNCQCQFYPPE